MQLSFKPILCNLDLILHSPIPHTHPATIPQFPVETPMDKRVQKSLEKRPASVDSSKSQEEVQSTYNNLIYFLTSGLYPLLQTRNA